MSRPSEPIEPGCGDGVLGIDPGSQATGWGIVRGPSASPRLVAAGTIRLPARLGFAERLHRLQVELVSLVERFSPVSAGVEAPFHGASARAALQLAHARGVALAVLAGAAIEVTEYAPATVKKSVTGNGRADKDQVARMVRTLLTCPGGELEQLRAGDRADALAVALCHLTGGARQRLQQAARRPGRRRPAAGEIVNLVRLRR